MKGVSEDLFHAVVPEKTVSIEDMEIMPVRISHDAANPVCYTVQSESKKSELRPIWAAFPMKS